MSATLTMPMHSRHHSLQLDAVSLTVFRKSARGPSNWLQVENGRALQLGLCHKGPGSLDDSRFTSRDIHPVVLRWIKLSTANLW